MSKQRPFKHTKKNRQKYILNPKNRITIFILSIIILTVHGSSHAYQNNKKARYFERFDQGFGTLTNGILQDSDGFFWFGSNIGLVQWDGLSIRRYTDTNSDLKNITYVNTIFEDRDNIIWLGTQTGGLYKYEKSNSRFTGYKHDPNDPESLSCNNIGTLKSGQLIAEDKDGSLWIGTNNGLNRFDKNKEVFTVYKNNRDDRTSLVNNEILSLLVTGDNTLWVGTKRGLCCFNRNKNNFTRYTHDDAGGKSISSDKINTILEDSRGVLWIGTPNGLNRFNRKTRTFTVYKNDPHNKTSIINNVINDIEEDEEGYLWLVHFPKNCGVTVFDPVNETFTNYTSNADKNSIADDESMSLYKDRLGNIWVISITATLSKHIKHKNPFRSFNREPGNSQGLQNRSVLNVIEDPYKKIWIIPSTPDFLFQYNKKNNTFKKYRSIKKILFAPGPWNSDGSLWIGDSQGALLRYNLYTKSCKKKYILSNSSILTVTRDNYNHNILWVTTIIDGLVKVNTKSGNITYYKHIPADQKSLSDNQIWTPVFQDDVNPDLLWVGTINGLNFFNKRTGHVERIYKYDKNDPHSISNNSIVSIIKTKKDDYWISTYSGINKFDPDSGRFERYTKSNGRFPANGTSTIFEDKSGHLWMASIDEGIIIRFNPETRKYKTFGKGNGVNFGHAFAIGHTQISTGEFFFVGNNGFTCFDPSQIIENNRKPPVFITALTQGADPIETGSAPEYSKRITINWKRPFFEFRMSSLNYTRPANNRYRYKLEGWDKQWFEAGTNRKGRYSGLNSGTYTLKVMGSNNDGIWSDKIAGLTVIVTTPFWETWWFYLSLCIIIIGGMILFFLLRIRRSDLYRQQLEMIVKDRTKDLVEAKEKAEIANKAKSTFLTNMSHELRTPLNSVLGYTEILMQKEQDTQKKHYLRSILSSGRSLLNLINDILDLSRIEAGKMELNNSATSIPDLVEEIRSIFQPMFKNTQLEFKIKVENNIPDLLLDELRLRQVLINLLGNALKFTDHGHVKLNCKTNTVSQKNDIVDLLISVEDTGKGILEKDQQLIFQAFEQSREHHESQHNGTGLGLSISKNIIEIMGGSIQVKSEQGKGSTFYIELPDIEVVAPKISNENENTFDPELISFEPATILIADDITENRDLLAAYLAPWDFTLLFATNGKEVIEIFNRQTPDLVLMDMKMPYMDGYEASLELKKNSRSKNVPVIAMSASITNQEEEQIRKICDGLLVKPVSQLTIINEFIKHLPSTKSENMLYLCKSEKLIFTNKEHIAALYEFALDGDMDEMLLYLETLKNKKPDLKDFCEHIGMLANNCEDEQLSHVLKKYLS